MIRKKTIGKAVCCWAISSGIFAWILRKRAEKSTYSADLMEPIQSREKNFYEKYVKRAFDIVCASAAITVFCPLYLCVAALVRIKLGSPVLFTQDRPGLVDQSGKEQIFKMYKFRSMTDEKDKNGDLMPDEVRLTSFGKKLRATSLDELPEAFNILNGTMSVIGPRPQLVRDMVFMTEEQRARHTAKPGLSGLAQINGRNDIDWNDKLKWDLKYIRKVSLITDIKIVLDTVGKAFIKREGITEVDAETATDYGDYLLEKKAVNQDYYNEKQCVAKRILNHEKGTVLDPNLVSIIMPSYNTAEFIAESIQSVLNQTYEKWELLIVDDCSTDNTDNIVEPFIKDKRIKYFKNVNNCGAAVSRNRAIKEAKGRWIAFLDSDDLWMPDKLEKQVNFMESHGYHFSYTQYIEIDEDGAPNGRLVSGPNRVTKTGFYNYCWPGCLTVMYDADTVGVIQIKDIKKNNDYAMWLKVSDKVDCYLLDEVLALYRKGRQGSVSTQKLLTLIQWHFKLFREAEEQKPILAIINTCRNMGFGLYKKIKYVKLQSK